MLIDLCFHLSCADGAVTSKEEGAGVAVENSNQETGFRFPNTHYCNGAKFK
jgi:hypothetical protein